MPASDARFLLELSTEKLPLSQGAAESLTVAVQRENGFEGDVTVTAADLPAGVSATPLVIRAGEAEGRLELRVESTAPHSLPTPVKIRGSSSKLQDERELSLTVCGAPGALDTSFEGGKVVVPVGAGDAYAYAMAAQADGKLLVAGTSHERGGDFAVLRFTRDGEIDESFGDGGLATTDLSGTADVARAVAVDPQGRIVVAGTTTGEKGLDFAVARYLPSGALDRSFGDAGKTVVRVGDDADTAYALVIQSDGKLVIGGDSNRGSAQSGVDFALVRLLEDGQLDERFGDAGVAIQSIASFGGRDSIYALALQTLDGEERLLAAGGEGDFSLARFRASGELDESFGEQGTLSGLFGSTIGAARGLTLNAEGEIVVVGHAQHDVALAKLSPQGSLVETFGEGGKVVTAVSAENWDEAQGVGVEADGKLLVAGFSYEGNSSSGNTLLLRYDASGGLDAGFGAEGIVLTEVAAPRKADQANALLIQVDERVPSERILVAGHASGSFSSFALTRFWR